jgi:hypothetical protein
LEVSAKEPKALLDPPVVFETSARWPKALLDPPVVLAKSTPSPTPVFRMPVRLVFPALAPRNVLSVPKLCRKRTPAFVTIPTDPDEVFGRSRLPASVIAPAAKLPEPSRRTMALAVLAGTALETTVAPWVPVTSPASEPVKFVADVALPLRLAVMVPAAKFPAPSRRTMALGVLVGTALLTTVPVWVPVTSPPRVPLKSPARVA